MPTMNNANQTNIFSRREVLKLGLGLSFSPLLANNVLSDITNAFDQPASNYQLIAKRPIPASGEMIPVVGLGTWRTFDAGNSTERRTALLEVLKTLTQKGGSVVDSSPMYGSS